MMMGRRKAKKTKDPKMESMDMMARMARKKGTANDWVNSVLEGAIRSKFMTAAEEEELALRRGGETRRQRELRLSHLYDSNASSKLVRNRARTIREPKQRTSRELSMADYNPYGTLDSGPVYEEEQKSPSQTVVPWTVGYRNSTSSPIVSPLGKGSEGWLERKFGKVLARDVKMARSASQLPAREPWTPSLAGSPHLWPKDAEFVTGAAVTTSNCQPFRPSSRLAHTSYSALHSVPPAAGLAHPQSLANTRGPAHDFNAGAGAKVSSPELTKRQPGENPLFSTGSVLARDGTPAEPHSPAIQLQKRLGYVDKRPTMAFNDSQVSTLKQTFRTRVVPSRGIPPGTSPNSTLRDGDSYVMGSPMQDDDGWTWNSDEGGPVKRESPRLKRWFDRQAKAEADLKRKIWKKQRAVHQLSRVKSAPSPVRAKSTRRSSKRSTASTVSRRSRKKKIAHATDDAEPKPGLKYWTGFTVMYSTRQDEKSIKARAQKRAKEREMRAKIKWRELGGLFAYLRMPSRRQAGVDELRVLYNSLRKACAELGTEATITRDRFWQLISATELPQIHANRLFSGFDVDRKDELDVRKFMCSLRLFKKPGEALVDKLAALFDIYHVHSATEYLRRADVIALLQVVADVEMEMDMMEKLAIRAMNAKFGNKSVWAMDISREGFVDMLNESEMLMAAFTNQYAATVGAV